MEKNKQQLERELFEMVYQWGKHGIVTDELSNAFQDKLKEITATPKIVSDFALQEATRIVDGEIGEDGLYKRKPIYSIDLFECEIGENKGGGVETTTLHKREEKIAFIKEIVDEII